MIRKFFRNAGIMAGAEIIARVKGVIILPLMTRYLGAMDFGVWSQVGIVVFTLSPLIVLGTDVALVRLLPGTDPDRQYRKFLGWFSFVLLSCMAAAAIVTLEGHWISFAFFGTGGEYEHFMPLVAVSFFATLLPNAGRTWLRIRNEGTTLAAATVMQAVLGIAAIGLAILSKVNLYGLVIYGMAGDLVLGLALFGFILVRQKWRQPDFSIVWPALRIGLPLLPGGYAMWGLNWMDRLFLVHYQTLAEIGVYAVATSLGYTVIQVFVNPIWAMYPNSVSELHNQGDHAGVDRLLHMTGGAMLLIALPAIAGLWALDLPIISLIAGANYIEGATVMPVVALAYLLSMMTSFGDVALILAYRQYLATLSISLAVGLNFLLNFILIPPMGILGAALATLGAFLFQLIFSTFAAGRVGPFWRQFRFPFRIGVAALAMAISVRVFSHFIGGGNVTRLAILVPVGALLYLGFVAGLRALPPSVSIAVHSWAKARVKSGAK